MKLIMRGGIKNKTANFPQAMCSLLQGRACYTLIMNERWHGLRLVLFDIGGVILRTDNPGPRLRLARRFGLDRAGLDQLVFGSPAARAAETGQGDEASIWEHARTALNMHPNEMDDFQRQFWAGDAVDISLFELMRMLHPDYQVGLLTNSWLADPLSMFRDRYGIPSELLDAGVDGVISSARIGVQKPDRRIFMAAVEHFGVSPQQAVFIDDFYHNVAAARELGMRAILFESATQTRRDLMNLLAV
jgi:FMN phosphatase YigB (HAD superfamily)